MQNCTKTPPFLHAPDIHGQSSCVRAWSHLLRVIALPEKVRQAPSGRFRLVVVCLVDRVVLFPCAELAFAALPSLAFSPLVAFEAASASGTYRWATGESQVASSLPWAEPLPAIGRSLAGDRALLPPKRPKNRQGRDRDDPPDVRFTASSRLPVMSLPSTASR